ncbi:MAG: hypothetical protein ACYC8S_00890 [Minisyncoccota bacterium]
MAKNAIANSKHYWHRSLVCLDTGIIPLPENKEWAGIISGLQELDQNLVRKRACAQVSEDHRTWAHCMKFHQFIHARIREKRNEISVRVIGESIVTEGDVQFVYQHPGGGIETFVVPQHCLGSIKIVPERKRLYEPLRSIKK